MLHRQIMFKQLEELQRQKKLQELNDSRQQNVINQQSLINGTPVREASQMFMFGNNTNLVHGFQSGSAYSQPVDGHSSSRFSHFQGSTHEFNGEKVDTLSRSSMFGPGFSQGQQEFDRGQEQDINASQDFTSLDPLEQKFLFNSEDNDLGGFGNMFEDTDNLQAFPSLQSGSWSALMQSALEETSSTDTGVQEEWSGLSFQNPEPSIDIPPSNLMEIGKNPTLWQNNTFQNASSLNLKPELLKTANASSSFPGEFKEGLLSSKASTVTAFRSRHSSGMSAIVDRSADFPTPDSNAQTSRHMLELLQKVDKFKEYRNGTSSTYTDSLPTNEMPKPETTFGLRLAPPTQRNPVNYFDLSKIAQQTVSNSTSQPNVWVDIPSQQNLSGMGFFKAPGGSPLIADVANNMIETASEASGHVLNSQSFGYTKGQEGKIPYKEEPFSERAEANASSLKQYDSNTRVIVKKEKDDSDPKDQLVKNLSHLPLLDGSKMHRNSSFVQMNLVNTSQYGTGTHSFAVNNNQELIVSQSKKRKFHVDELLPWHKEATQGSSRIQDMSIAELEWARASNRVPEKLKEETEEALGDSRWMVNPKKRIIFTTQLMQVLLRPAPATILADEATACYDSVTYFAARLAVGDACSLANRSRTPCDITDSSLGKNVISKGSGDRNLSIIIEDFIGRAKKLEDELLRLENGGSYLEIRMESQDLERFSVINRFAKFHSRAQMVKAETGSSGGASTVPKLHPQRYVTASLMPRTVPEGHNCLSL